MTILTRAWRRWGKWLQVIGTLILFGYLLKTTPIVEAWQRTRNVYLPFALVSLVLTLLSLVIYACVWAIILKSLGFSVPFRQVCSLFFQSLFINNFVTFLGGDLMRGYKLGRATHRMLDAGVSILASRLIMLNTLFILAGVTIWWWGPRAGWGENVRWAGAALTVLALLPLAVYRWPLRWVAGWPARDRPTRFKGMTHQIVQAFMIIGEQPRVLLTLYLGHLLAQLVSQWAVWWLAVGLGVPIAWWQILLVLSVLRLVLLLPVSFNGLGLREVGLVGLLTSMAIDATGALALGLGISFLAVLFSLPGGVLFLKDALLPDLAD